MRYNTYRQSLMHLLIKHIIVSLSIILLLTSHCERTNILPKDDYTGLTDTIYDIEGNTYKTVGIGTQIWMTENLRSTRLNNGRILPNIKNDTNWFYTNSPGYCFYNHDSVQFNKIYGPLYNYNVVRTDSICPTGWRVPTYKDWIKLAQFVGGIEEAGGKLKQMDGSLWEGSNHGFKNSYNFNALPGGFRHMDISKTRFLDKGTTGYWWTADSIDFRFSRGVYITITGTALSENSFKKNSALSIRCIKK